jgi:hypothetical protein
VDSHDAFALDLHAVEPGLIPLPRSHKEGLIWPACECAGCFDEGGSAWTTVTRISASR